jgi:hypothetical protein
MKFALTRRSLLGGDPFFRLMWRRVECDVVAKPLELVAAGVVVVGAGGHLLG